MEVRLGSRIPMTLFACLTLSAVMQAADASPCTVRVQKLKVIKKDYRDLQRFVNEGHQPWRLTAYVVANNEILVFLKTQKTAWDVFALPVRAVEEGQRRSVFGYDRSDKSG